MSIFGAYDTGELGLKDKTIFRYTFLRKIQKK